MIMSHPPVTYPEEQTDYTLIGQMKGRSIKSAHFELLPSLSTFLYASRDL